MRQAMGASAPYTLGKRAPPRGSLARKSRGAPGGTSGRDARGSPKTSCARSPTASRLPGEAGWRSCACGISDRAPVRGALGRTRARKPQCGPRSDPCSRNRASSATPAIGRTRRWRRRESPRKRRAPPPWLLCQPPPLGRGSSGARARGATSVHGSRASPPRGLAPEDSPPTALFLGGREIFCRPGSPGGPQESAGELGPDRPPAGRHEGPQEDEGHRTEHEVRGSCPPPVAVCDRPDAHRVQGVERDRQGEDDQGDEGDGHDLMVPPTAR